MVKHVLRSDNGERQDAIVVWRCVAVGLARSQPQVIPPAR